MVDANLVFLQPSRRGRVRVQLVIATFRRACLMVSSRRGSAEAIYGARPDFSLARYPSHIIYSRDEDRDHIVEGLLEAGLPE